MDVRELILVKNDYQKLETNWAELINSLRVRDLTIFLDLLRESILLIFDTMIKIFLNMQYQYCLIYKIAHFLPSLQKSMQHRKLKLNFSRSLLVRDL